MAPPISILLLIALSLFSNFIFASRPWILSSYQNKSNTFNNSKKFEGSSNLIDLKYHGGPVLSKKIIISFIWYGTWSSSQKNTICAFINSISNSAVPEPSVYSWWKTVTLYGDQTGKNISRIVTIGNQKTDSKYSKGKTLNRLDITSIIKDAVFAKTNPLILKPRNSVVFVLTSEDVFVNDFCRAICGYHYFTSPSVTGIIVPYAWVGNSKEMCPSYCAYPFTVPTYMKGVRALKSPNGDVGVDGMISVMGHELVEMASDELDNAWFLGDALAPVEIADLCEGIYGSGAGGTYLGRVLKDKKDGASFNLRGVDGRRFMVQWIWNPVLKFCYGPNAIS